MTVNVYRDQLYPYFIIKNDAFDYTPVDLPAATIEWIERVFKEFDEVQDLLGAIYYGNYA